MLRFKHTKIFSMFFLYRKFNSKQFISRKEIQNEIQENIKYNLIPDWWINIYPLTYYFIGCYLKEYQIKMKKHNNKYIRIQGKYFCLGNT